MKLQEFQFFVIHKPGKTHNNADAPSRLVLHDKSSDDSPFSGHLRVTRTLDRIRKHFFWPKMRTTIENYIRQCDICVQRKAPAPTANNGTGPIQTLEVSEAFTFWALDYMGPLQESK